MALAKGSFMYHDRDRRDTARSERDGMGNETRVKKDCNGALVGVRHRQVEEGWVREESHRRSPQPPQPNDYTTTNVKRNMAILA